LNKVFSINQFESMRTLINLMIENEKIQEDSPQICTPEYNIFDRIVMEEKLPWTRPLFFGSQLQK